MRFHAASVFVDGDDGDDDAVFGEVLAITDDNFFDLFEGAGVHEDAPGSDGIAAIRAVFGELERVAVFENEDFSGNAAKLIRERGVAEEMSILPVDRNEIFRFDELQNELLFFLAGVAGNVNSAAGIVVIDEGAAAEHVVEHAEDGFLISGNNAGGEDDAIVFVDGDEAMIVDRDARK